MTKYCPSCGEALVDEANFCKSCGAKIAGGVQAAQTTERPLIEKSYTIAVIIGYIAAILIPILGIIIGVYLMTRKDSSDAKHGKYMIIVAVIVWILSILSLNIFY